MRKREGGASELRQDCSIYASRSRWSASSSGLKSTCKAPPDWPLTRLSCLVLTYCFVHLAIAAASWSALSIGVIGPWPYWLRVSLSEDEGVSGGVSGTLLRMGEFCTLLRGDTDDTVGDPSWRKGKRWVEPFEAAPVADFEDARSREPRCARWARALASWEASLPDSATLQEGQV